MFQPFFTILKGKSLNLSFIFRFYDNLIKKIFLEEIKKNFFLIKNFEKNRHMYTWKSLKFVAFSFFL